MLLIVLAGCTGEADPPADSDARTSKAQALIEQAQDAHGSEVLDHAVVEFDFRGKHFVARQDGGNFRYTRTYTDDTTGARIREVLTADSLYRTVDGKRVALTPDEQRSLETPLNSVVYFAILPQALTDPAVQPRYLDTTTIDGVPYHEIEVTFREEGGGRDHEDRYVYWIHQDRHTVDYLAYYFFTGEGGSRFRKAVNPRTVGGVRVQDYVNYTAAADTLGPASIEDYDDVMQAGGLEKVSDVVLENVQVRPLTDRSSSASVFVFRRGLQRYERAGS